MSIRLLAAVTTCLLFAASCSSDSESAPTTDEPDTTEASSLTPQYEAFAELPVACGGTLPEPPSSKQYEEAADQEISPDQTVTATITTSCGDLVLTLDPAKAPNTVNNFVFLAREGFYDGVVSHRLVPNFVLQIGDPTASGSGGPGYRFADELPDSAAEYSQGAVVMANSGPDTNGSQIFINLVDNSENLVNPNNPQILYSKFGQLTAGQEVLDQIAQIPTSGPQGDSPTQGLYIEGITIEIS